MKNMVNPVIANWHVQKEEVGSVKYYEGLTSENIVLSQYPTLYPRLNITGPVMEYMFQDRDLAVMRPSFINSLIDTGSIEYWDAEELEWEFKTGSSEKVTALNKLERGDRIGEGGLLPFRIHLTSLKYKEGDVLYPAVSHRNQVIVVGKSQEGTGAIYSVKYATYDKNGAFPEALLAPNLEWKKVDAVSGEYTSMYGSTEINLGLAKLKFWTHMSTTTKRLDVTDKAQAIKLRVIAQDSKNQPISGFPEMIIDEREAKFIMETEFEREKRVLIGQGAGKQILDPSSNFHIRVSPGVLQMMERSHLQTYPMYGSYTLENFIADIVQPVNSFSTITPGTYDIYSGAGGIEKIREKIKKYFGTLPTHLDKDLYYSTSKGEGGFNKIKVSTPYFDEIDYWPYGSFRFHLLPALDNPEIFGGLRDPETGYLMSSFTYMCSFNGAAMKNNIRLIERKNSKVFTYVNGTYSPVGPFDSAGGSKGGYHSSNEKAGYSLVYQRVHGSRIHDISAVTILQPNVKLY